MKHPYLSIIFGLITCLSITAALSKTPNMAEQMALTNICETAMLTKDTMTAQHVAQRIMDWSGLEDTQIIESAIECLSNQRGKKLYIPLRKASNFLRFWKIILLIHIAIQKIGGRSLSLKIGLVTQKIIFFKKN